MDRMGDDHLQLVVCGAPKNVEAQYVEMMVPLYSYGCQHKINRALSNIKGIYSVNVNFQQQKVTVWGICNKHDILSIVKKKRKGARFWNSDDDQNIVDQHPSSAPSSPQHPPSTKRRSLQAMLIKGSSSLKLNLSLIKSKSLNWRKAVMSKAYARSNSF